jgi:O-antigen/teichoic acid export membrane protein
MGHSKVPLYGSSIALFGNVALNFLFIPLLGFSGPAIATVVITYLLVIFYLHRIKTITQTSYAAVFPWISLIKIIVLSVFVGIITIPILLSIFESRIIKILVTGLFYFGSLFYIFYRFKFIKEEDMDFVRHSFANIIAIFKK